MRSIAIQFLIHKGAPSASSTRLHWPRIHILVHTHPLHPGPLALDPGTVLLSKQADPTMTNLVGQRISVWQHFSKNNSFVVTSMFDMFKLSILSKEHIFVLVSLMTWL